MIQIKSSKVLRQITIILLITAFSIGIIACSGDAITGNGGRRGYTSVTGGDNSDNPDNPNTPDDSPSGNYLIPKESWGKYLTLYQNLSGNGYYGQSDKYFELTNNELYNHYDYNLKDNEVVYHIKSVTTDTYQDSVDNTAIKATYTNVKGSNREFYIFRNKDQKRCMRLIVIPNNFWNDFIHEDDVEYLTLTKL